MKGLATIFALGLSALSFGQVTCENPDGTIETYNRRFVFYIRMDSVVWGDYPRSVEDSVPQSNNSYKVLSIEKDGDREMFTLANGELLTIFVTNPNKVEYDGFLLSSDASSDGVLVSDER